MRRLAHLAVFASLFLIAVVALELPDTTVGVGAPGPDGPSRFTASAIPTPPSLTRADANRQDRETPEHRRREQRAVAGRPLLAVLPLELAGVRIEITGLAADQRTTVITIAPGTRGRAYASAFYRRALAAYGDPGVAYAVRWTP